MCSIFKKSLIIMFCLLILLTPYRVNAYSEFNKYLWSSYNDLYLNTSAPTNSANINENSNSLGLECGSCILIEQTTGQVLYSYNPHEKLRPASVTKLMSILLIMDSIKSGKINYDTQIPCSENAASMGGSQIWLDTTETLSVKDMLKAICVVSANDRCNCNG